MHSFPSSQDYVSSEYNSLSLSSEEYNEEPTLSVKLIPTSTESSYESTTPLCKTRIKKINPNDLARQRGYDIVDNPNIMQTIEVEECENAGSPCSYVSNVKTACRQRYMSIKVSVTRKDKKSSIEEFIIPSVCECAFFSRNSLDLRH